MFQSFQRPRGSPFGKSLYSKLSKHVRIKRVLLTQQCVALFLLSDWLGFANCAQQSSCRNWHSYEGLQTTETCSFILKLIMRNRYGPGVSSWSSRAHGSAERMLDTCWYVFCLMSFPGPASHNCSKIRDGRVIITKTGSYMKWLDFLDPVAYPLSPCNTARAGRQPESCSSLSSVPFVAFWKQSQLYFRILRLLQYCRVILNLCVSRAKHRKFQWPYRLDS